MVAYISINFAKKESFTNEVNAIKRALHEFQIESLVFVDNYTFNVTQEREMMKHAMAEIERCDLLIAETSDKGIGIGVEVGYARAKNKPVIYVRKITAGHSTTVSGISDFQIIYKNAEDLQRQMVETITELRAKNFKWLR
jgi:2'-deoxynucleoside 5'-phosphate N-hydrolase